VLTDLGTLGGNNGQANSLNDAGAVVGKADLPGSQTHNAFLWRNGVMTDLGIVGSDKCSTASSINSTSQIVGCSSDCHTCAHASLWENGGPIVDLNNLVPPGSAVTLTEATFINDSGEIAAQGSLPNGDTHAFLLIPCEQDDHDACRGESMNTATLQIISNPAVPTQYSEPPANKVNQFRKRSWDRYQFPIEPIAPRD
jgi:probable HAF family extracellular repeat protein